MYYMCDEISDVTCNERAALAQNEKTRILQKKIELGNNYEESKSNNK